MHQQDIPFNDRKLYLFTIKKKKINFLLLFLCQFYKNIFQEMIVYIIDFCNFATLKKTSSKK